MKLEGVEPNGRARGGKAVQKIEKNSGGEGRKKRRLKLNRSNAEYNKIAAEELANKENDSKMGQDSKMPPQPVVKPSKLKSKKSKNNDSPSNEQKAASKVLWITTEKEKEEENIKVRKSQACVLLYSLILPSPTICTHKHVLYFVIIDRVSWRCWQCTNGYSNDGK